MKIVCSVIILNYFGEKVLKDVVDSVESSKFPKDKFEVIIVDNNSKDRSHKIMNDLAVAYSNIQNIYLEDNLGFSRGNNVGIVRSKGEYVILLNNDCLVEPNWLAELVKTADMDKKIFAVNSKILLYPQYLNILLQTKQQLVAVSAFITNSKLNQLTSKKKIILELHKEKKDYRLEIPFDKKDTFFDLTLLFNSNDPFVPSKKSPNQYHGIRDLINFKKTAAKVQDYKIENNDLWVTFRFNPADVSVKKLVSDKIQNAGIVVFQDGYGRDIGAIVRYHQQHYEVDRGQFNQVKEVYAACGAAVLYRRDVLKKLGNLDESFFMYYEDVEICERARLLGFKTYFSPLAIVRHLHALSSKEWSPFFVYHAEKGRLLHVFYNFPFRIFAQEYLFMILKSLTGVIYGVIYTPLKLQLVYKNIKARKKVDQFEDIKRKIQFFKVIFFFFIFFIPLYNKKFIRQRQKYAISLEENYQDILKGKWYFN